MLLATLWLATAQAAPVHAVADAASCVDGVCYAPFISLDETDDEAEPLAVGIIGQDQETGEIIIYTFRMAQQATSTEFYTGDYMGLPYDWGYLAVSADDRRIGVLGPNRAVLFDLEARSAEVVSQDEVALTAIGDGWRQVYTANIGGGLLGY
jgi:hypothetical protein